MGIFFGAGNSWAALSQVELARLSKSTAPPAFVRVFLLALSRANRLGHAELAPGELARFLGNGEPILAPNVSRAVRQAVEAGFLARESRARCLVLSSYLFQKEGLGSSTCKVHGNKLRMASKR